MWVGRASWPKRELRKPTAGHHILHIVHHHQLHDRHQHVHSHHPGELQSGPSGGRDWDCWRWSGDVLYSVVQVNILFIYVPTTTRRLSTCSVFSAKYVICYGKRRTIYWTESEKTIVEKSVESGLSSKCLSFFDDTSQVFIIRYFRRQQSK